jgi:chromosomal replication initiator protein
LARFAFDPAAAAGRVRLVSGRPPDTEDVMSDLWTQVLGQLRTTTKRSVYQSWLERIELVDQTADSVQLGVPDDGFRDYVATHHLDAIRESLQKLIDRPVAVELVVASDLRPYSRPSIDRGPATRKPQTSLPFAPADHALPPGETLPAASTDDRLSGRFTFDSFVIGKSNEFAASAALAVVSSPGVTYNPLFLYGGIGTGKTHLLKAVGHAIQAKRPGSKVLYVPAETFADDTIHAMISKEPSTRADVRHQYRSVDVLLVDDVQFLQGKTKTQDEFFHTFNALHHAGKQIVLSCDRFPSELQEFHDRLRSRFDWGLVAELAPPDRELRQAILVRKATEFGMTVPLDVVSYLADHLRNSVRELEGALNKLNAHSHIARRPVDLTLARQVLGPMIELPSRNLTVEVIQRVVAHHFNLKIADLKGSKRHRSVVVPRMIAVSLTRKHTALSFPDIGRAFGGRDHSTAIHAVQKVDWMLATDPEVQATFQTLENALGK